MLKRNKAFLGLAILLGTTATSAVMADDFDTHLSQAQATLTKIFDLIDGIDKRHAAATASAGDSTESLAAVFTCPACGMKMTRTPTASNTRAIKVKGVTWYCCAGCDMSKIEDK